MKGWSQHEQTAIQSDRAVRLAEDGVTDRTTLEECIAGVWIMPKTVSASSPAEHENKGESMSEHDVHKLDEMMEDRQEPALRTELLVEDGMITTRITLHVTHHKDVQTGGLAVYVSNFLCLRGGSVRVVPDAEIDASWRAACESARLASSAIDDLTRERDAAIRERDEWRRSWILSEESGTRLLAERNAARDDADGLRARVAAPAAEPVANSSEHPNGSAEPRWWLTASERETLQKARSMFSCECYGEPKSWRRVHERWRDDCDALLARNSPPMVKLPPAVHKDILAALAAAGVEVKSQS